MLASFSGGRAEKARAHLLLALAGSALLSIGTAVNSSIAAAALVTVPVTFAVFFAGVLGPNAATGALGAMLSYVLPAASPGTVSMIPDRLLGWWMASACGTIAVLALSSEPEADPLRRAATRSARELSRLLAAALEGPVGEERMKGAVEAKHSLLGLFSATPFRPLGLGAADQALADVVELLEWCTSLVVDALREHPDLRDAEPPDRALIAASAQTLGEIGELLDGVRAMPDLERLERLRRAGLSAAERLAPDESDFRAHAQLSFHAQAIAACALATGAEAAVAERLAAPAWRERQRERYEGLRDAGRARVASAAAAAARHASVRSVWFINSLRAAAALGAAVAVADLSSVQHGFWVVLGTLSVLRSNAASTGATALRALGGTAIGFIVGGALLVAIGDAETALWVALPFSVFLAAYSPGTAPFAVGQAAFTVTVAVLFNLLAPVGWKVGILRIEDVAIGCAVSVLVGAMFWPRGVAAVVGDDLADAYRAGAAYLSEGVRFTAGLSTDEPAGAHAAVASAQRLDDALRGFLAEQGSKRIRRVELWRLVGGTLRLRLTAQAIARIPPDAAGVAEVASALERRVEVLDGWYARLAQQLDRPRGLPPATLSPPTLGPETVVHEGSGSHYTVWLCEHLDHLAEHLDELIAPALRIAELRRAPWWR
ncbi:MAG TPA: FUSC family protein [Solirubrobacteraceae bacterium]|nr:FUSC family protein [Solirubrobacteraceae bacterium]